MLLPPVLILPVLMLPPCVDTARVDTARVMPAVYTRVLLVVHSRGVQPGDIPESNSVTFRRVLRR